MNVKILILVVAMVMVLVGFAPFFEGITNYSGLHLEATAHLTATPMFQVWNKGVGESLVLRDSGGTPEVAINSAGAMTINQQMQNTNGVNIAAPTTIATAIPALAVGNAGVSKPFEVSDSGAVVFDTLNGGGVRVIAPTDIPTAVPGLSVNNPGDSNALRVIAKGTPALVVQANGDISTQSGWLLEYSAPNVQVICGQDTVTDTVNVLHGLTTPYFGICTMETITGDAYACSAIVSSSTVTVKIRNNAATPAPNATPAAANWCVFGIK